jgi:hypothetical protein
MYWVRFLALPDFLREQGPLRLMRTIEELLEWKSSGSGLENGDNDHGNLLRSPRNTLYRQKLALTSPTSGGCSVGIVRLQTKATEFSFFLEMWLLHSRRDGVYCTYHRLHDNCWAYILHSLQHAATHLGCQVPDFPGEGLYLQGSVSPCRLPLPNVTAEHVQVSFQCTQKKSMYQSNCKLKLPWTIISRILPKHLHMKLNSWFTVKCTVLLSSVCAVWCA